MSAGYLSFEVRIGLPQAAPLIEGLGGGPPPASKHDFGARADDRHLWISGPSDALALSSKVCPMSFPPILK
jgi:hypothetical protein